MVNKILGIGIDQYLDGRIKKLNNCQSDLNKLVNLLQSKYQFDEVELLLQKEQTTRSFIYKTIYEYIINSLDDENLIILFLGHGEYNPRIETSFWLPSDADINDQSSWISTLEILNFVKNADLLHFCLISDNCYSGAIFQEFERGGGIKSLENRKSRFALTSGSIEKVKDGKIGESSPFNKVLCEILEENQEEEISIEVIANQVILKFPKEISQTPRSGTLNGLGHDGGAFILRLKETDSKIIKFKEIELPLNIYNNVKIDYKCTIPFFEDSDKFDCNNININLQNVVYEILSDLRNDLIDAEKGLNEIPQISDYFYEIGYNIHLISSKFISVDIVTFSSLGGPYPRNQIISLNYVLSPERKIKLNDIIEIDNEKSFFDSIIKKYSEDGEHKQILLDHLKYYSINGIQFSINEKSIGISFLNCIPKVVQCYAFIDLPLEDFNIDLGEIYNVN
ncbi:putative Peptidase C14 caspase catalytic subunit p20 [Flavobacterium sp. 9AF]|uniref:caspase family protein n=1 Tax=Flavobacterium sp. 9AF TaxID=2653142 RepID=UPI0012F30D6C|nr:caspase family protein [Flavobacterium sp. 9AF]VXB72094.1 putative Peptidase C14 caspase catalytic subunit p20 [Flavobacterium sp. 9AF]